MVNRAAMLMFPLLLQTIISNQMRLRRLRGLHFIRTQSLRDGPFLPTVNGTVLTELRVPVGGADLRSSSPQPDTSLDCETTDTGLVHPVVWLFTSQPQASRQLPYYTACWQKHIWVNNLPNNLPGWVLNPRSTPHRFYAQPASDSLHKSANIFTINQYFLIKTHQ